MNVEFGRRERRNPEQVPPGQLGGLCLLLGSPGTGKSVIKQALQQLPEKQHLVAAVARTLHTYSNTVNILCEAFQGYARIEVGRVGGSRGTHGFCCHIENGLHYTRDETLGEDRCRVRKGKSPQVLALRNVAVHLLRGMDTPSVAAAVRQLAADPQQALDLLNDAGSTSE